MTLLPLGLKGHWPSLLWPHLEFYTPAHLPWPGLGALPGLAWAPGRIAAVPARCLAWAQGGQRASEGGADLAQR